MTSHGEYWNENMETLSTDDFNNLHQGLILKQLNYIWKHSQFYQKKFRQAGILPSDIKDISDLGKLPFTVKSELRKSQLEYPPFGDQVAAPIDRIKRVYSTSGTTGRPTFIGLTKSDIELWKEAACRAFWTGGFRPDSIVPLVVAPYFVAASYADAIEEIGMVIPIGVGATDRLISAFQHIGGNALLSTSSFPLHFANSLIKRGIEPKSLGIRFILAGGEPGAAISVVRQKVEDIFGCLFLEMMGNGCQRRPENVYSSPV